MRTDIGPRSNAIRGPGCPAKKAVTRSPPSGQPRCWAIHCQMWVPSMLGSLRAT